MKKALTITIAGTLFTIEEDAYLRLDGYLKSIHTYFGTSAESNEIVGDIEARIAEQLLERKTIQGIITIEGVEHVISTMGRVEDFGERPESASSTSSSSSSFGEDPTARRRLYRNADDIVIAGVASGLANFFGIDPLIMRIGFIILGFITSGGAIFLYLLLAIFIPKAVTPAEKMQQRGGPMTLNEFKETIKTNSQDLVGKDSKVRIFIEKLLKLFGKIVLIGVKIIIYAIGLGIVLASIFGFVMATFTALNLAFNIHSPYIEFPVTQVISNSMYYSLLILGYLLSAIALFIIGALGVSILRKKLVVSTRLGAGLIGVWLVMAIYAGFLAVRVAPDVKAKVDALPQYQQVVAMSDLRDFNQVELHDEVNLTLVQGPEFSIVEEGRQIDIERTHLEVKDGTLIISTKSLDKACYFLCSSNHVTVTVTMPQVQGITANDVTRFNVEGLTGDQISLNLTDIARGTVSSTARELLVNQKDVSRLTLSGTTTSLSLNLADDARFEGQDLQAQNGSAKLTDIARAIVNIHGNLTIEARDVSRLTYYGMPMITQQIYDAARVRSASSTVQTIQPENQEYQ